MPDIRIDFLAAPASPDRAHELPAMRGGLAVRLAVAQILGLIELADIRDHLAATNVAFDPPGGGNLAGSATVAAALAAVDALLTASRAASGWRNLLANPRGLVNQRGYANGTATTAANQYTLDRWRVVTSGQKLSWTEASGYRTMTAPAGGVEQVIEGAAIVTGTYVLSWSGTATATINGAAVANGATVNLAGGTNATLRFAGGTFALPQIEWGVVPTRFEVRPPALELSLCQRFYWRGLPAGGLNFASYAVGALGSWVIAFPVTMQTTPSLSSDFSGITLASCGTPVIAAQSPRGCRLSCLSTAVTTNAYFFFGASDYIAADAEL